MERFVIILTIILGIIAIAQVMRVLELSRKLTGKREEDIPQRFNELNGLGMLLFMFFLYGLFGWSVAMYGDGGLGPSATEHGDKLDWIWDLNIWIISAVFFVTNTLLFFFAFKYHGRKGRKAFWFPHNNKLELIWTVIPAIVLAIIIVLGLQAWGEFQDESPKDAHVVEIFSEQFRFQARYAGEDNVLGQADYKLIGSIDANELGIVTKDQIDASIVNYEGIIAGAHNSLANGVWSDVEEAKLRAKVKNYEILRQRLLRMKANYSDSLDATAMDDIVLKELHLLAGENYEIKIRSKDVIHSVYFPHFRAQMNAVPGMVTRMKFKPTISTDSMRVIQDKPEFDYILLCNKICGINHYAMNMKVIVHDREDIVKDLLTAMKDNGLTPEVQALIEGQDLEKMDGKILMNAWIRGVQKKATFGEQLAEAGSGEAAEEEDDSSEGADAVEMVEDNSDANADSTGVDLIAAPSDSLGGE